MKRQTICLLISYLLRYLQKILNEKAGFFILPIQTLRHQYNFQMVSYILTESLPKSCRHFFYEHSNFALKKAKAEIIQIKF